MIHMVKLWLDSCQTVHISSTTVFLCLVQGARRKQ